MCLYYKPGTQDVLSHFIQIVTISRKIINCLNQSLTWIKIFSFKLINLFTPSHKVLSSSINGYKYTPISVQEVVLLGMIMFGVWLVHAHLRW